MLNNKYQSIAGFKIPSIAIYGVVIITLLFFLKNSLTGLFSNLFKSESDIKLDAVIEDNLKTLEKNASVQSQLTVSTRSIANQLYDAMNGLGTNYNTIVRCFTDITGPNQMAAVYLAYGRRKLGLTTLSTFPHSFDGDLIGALKSELSQSELTKEHPYKVGTGKFKIIDRLNWLNQFK